MVDSPQDFSPDRESIARYTELLAGIGTIAESLGTADPTTVARFLDVGCNYPYSLDLARFLYGWDAVGVEPSPAGAIGARELGVDVRSEFLSPNSDLGDPFDLILASEVIEHVTDPLEFLQTIRTRLAPGGRAVLTTPAAEIVDPREDPNSALLAISPGFHVFLASVRGMKILLARAGYSEFTVVRDQGTLKITARASEPTSPQLTGGVPVSSDDLDRYYEWRGRKARSRSALAVGMWTRLLRLRIA
ncbi:MAG TPA: class I SAM-dependent methyltransferase, partial [Galbitalea sp.]|nr:class I SAM-dependent methyltransferase [Galbitalea sp.]